MSVLETGQTATEQARAGWHDIAFGYDELITPLTIPLTEAALRRVEIHQGVRLLDVAAGSGALSLTAARLGAEVVATDIAPGMIERLQARARTEGLGNIEGRVMDGQELDFEDGAFDVGASSLGVNLFPDWRRGIGELARVTKPGEKVLIIALGQAQKAEFLGVFLGALQASIPGFTPPDFTDSPPTRLADPEKLRRELRNVGLTDIVADTVSWRMEFRSGTHLWDMVLSSNPVGRMLVANLTDEQRSEVKAGLDGALRERSGGGGPAVLTTDVNIGVGTR